MKDFLFVWVPKCAGTSISTILIKKLGMKKIKSDFNSFQNGGNVTFVHNNINDLIKNGYVSRDYFDSAFKFATVRNPWDRCVSLFAYLMIKAVPFGVKAKKKFPDFIELISNGVDPIGLYNSKRLSHANPMCKWLKDENGKIIVDFVAKIEDKKQMKELRSRLGLAYEFPVLNRSHHKNYRSYYNDELIEKVAKIYKEDIDTFGYKL